jgi:uncharacterized DUF497 family protein
MKIAGFDWDSDNWPKCGRHSLSQEEIERALHHADIAPDFKHSQQEARYIAISHSEQGRPIFVAFTIRQREGQYFIRPISARRMHAKEAKSYEKST